MRNRPLRLLARLILLLAGLAAVILTIFSFIFFTNQTRNRPLPTRTELMEIVPPAPSQVSASEAGRATRIDVPATFTPRAEVATGGFRLSSSASAGGAGDDGQEQDQTPPVNLPPTLTPSPLPQFEPTLAVTPLETSGDTGDEKETGQIPIPTPVPTFEIPENTTNILLLGSDTPLQDGVGRTDTMIIVSINHDGPTASMVSLPRDLYVYIPGWQMNRLNTALSHGASIGYPGGAIAQLTDTILYNFGVPIHYYAQIDFEGFKQAVDLMGGVEVAVSCALEDWRLKSPELDPEDEENWEKFALEPGLHTMDGDMALWYVRSRRSTSDFDRGRRQQQLLRSMLNQGVDLGLLARAPDFWQTYRDAVNTDIDIGRILQLAALAPAVRENGIQHLYIVGDEVQSYVVPETKAQVQLPVWEEMQDTFRRLFLPPALNRATRPPITVEVVNAADNPDLTELAFDNLRWFGFEPQAGVWDGQIQQNTTIQYFGQHFKGSFDWLLSWIFARDSEEIALVTDTPYPTNYRVVLGRNYVPCRPQLFAPQIYLD